MASGKAWLSTTVSPRYYGVVTLVSILQVGESGDLILERLDHVVAGPDWSSVRLPSLSLRPLCLSCLPLVLQCVLPDTQGPGPGR